MKILGTGLSGLVGSRIVELLKDHTFENLSLETGVDITNRDVVRDRIGHSDAPWVFHFAAKTDVDAAEAQRSLGEKGSIWHVNVLATERIASVCKDSGKKLLYVSTDFVFDGTKDSYNEEDTPNPQGWYAVTKYEGEKRVTPLGDDGLIMRLAFPYRAKFTGKKDFVASIKEKLINNENLQAPTDQLFTPTFIDDVARAIDVLITNNTSGIVHVVGNQSLSPYDAAQKIAITFGLDRNLIKPTTFESYYRGRAPRPFHAVLKNDKITKFGVRMATFDEGLLAVKSQV